MGRAAVIMLLLFVFALPAAGGGVIADDSVQTESDKNPRINAVYPNPIADQDAGEFVTLSLPPDTHLGQYALADDETTVPLPNVTVSGRLSVSTAPDRTRELVDTRVLSVDGLALANSGEPLRLVRDGETIDRIAYTDAPEGSIRVRTANAWRPIGATDWPVVTGESGTVEAFVLPDGSDVAVDHLAAADDRILLAAYTLTSERVADALVAARERNVTVRVLVDGAPVGGLSRREADLLDRLVHAGAEVRAVGGPHARYKFHHAKYAVSDGKALVVTENWKPAGIGGTSSRGWGVVTDQQRIVSALVDTFGDDTDWQGAVPWKEYRSTISFTSVNATTGQYPTRFDPTTVSVTRTRLLVAPDNAETAVVGVIDNATQSLAVEQVSIGGRNTAFLQATLDAARRGVRVRILLSSAWYTDKENQRLVDYLNQRADRENLPLKARLAEPQGRFEKIHTKGAVVDGDQVILGSLNWNNNSARNNREVVLVLEGKKIGTYFERAFDADWSRSPMLPIGYVVAIGLVAGGVLLVVRRVRFDDEPGVTVSPDDRCLTEN